MTTNGLDSEDGIIPLLYTTRGLGYTTRHLYIVGGIIPAPFYMDGTGDNDGIDDVSPQQVRLYSALRAASPTARVTTYCVSRLIRAKRPLRLALLLATQAEIKTPRRSVV